MCWHLVGNQCGAQCAGDLLAGAHGQKDDSGQGLTMHTPSTFKAHSMWSGYNILINTNISKTIITYLKIHVSQDISQYIKHGQNLYIEQFGDVSVFGPDSLELQLRQETMVMPKRPSGRPKSAWPKGCRCGLPEDSQSSMEYDGIARELQKDWKKIDGFWLDQVFKVNAWRGSWAAFWMLTRLRKGRAK